MALLQPKIYLATRDWEPVLNALAEVSMVQRRAGEAPSIFDAAKSGRVRYRKELPGHEDWQTAAETFARGWGDCEDLAIWLAADLRLAGKNAARVVVRRSRGGNGWHALVHDGTKLRDPSKVLGMGR